MKISIIGTSKITEAHIRTIQKNKSKIIAISSTRKNSKKVNYFAKKYKIKNIFKNWKDNIRFTEKFHNSAFLITCRIKDNQKVLKHCCKTGKKIFIEKPVFLKEKEFIKYKKYKRQIFVGYNRIFYNNIKYLKKAVEKLKHANVIVKCPEASRIDIIKNSCHIISILLFLFGSIKLIQKFKSKNYINCIFKNNKNFKICIFFNLGSSDNFSIEIFDNYKRYLLSPIENLKLFSGVKITKSKSNQFYNPVVERSYNEFDHTKLKPGFDKQFKVFKNFSEGKNKKIINDIIFSETITKICNMIVR